MNPLELFNQVKELIEKKDFAAAQKFIEKHKDELGEYLEQAKNLLATVKGADGILGKVSGLFK